MALSRSEERLSLATLYSGVGIWDYNVQTKSMYWHDSMYVVYGISKDHDTPSIDVVWKNALDEEERLRVEQEMQQSILEKRAFSTEFSIVWPDGQTRWIKVEANLFKDRYDEAFQLLGTHIDITEHKHVQESLKLSSNVFTHAREGIIITDDKGDIINVNRSFTRLTRYENNSVLGQHVSLLQSERHPESFFKTLLQKLEVKGHWDGEIWCRRQSGEEFLAMVTICQILGAEDKIKNYIILFSDITISKAQQNQLEYIAHYDMLTNLPNRLLMFERLAQALSKSQRNGHPLAVAFLDLDGFKCVNDEYGHDVGDTVLIKLSKYMKNTLRESDTLGRIGGDEFLVILEDIDDIEDIKPILDRLLKAASEFIVLNSGTIQLSASIGVTISTKEKMTADKLVRQADEAMYDAKAAGKNRYCLYEPNKDNNANVNL